MTDQASVRTNPIRSSPDQWLALRIYSRAFRDAQDARISFENRARSGTMDPDFTDQQITLLEKLEANAARMMRNELKRCAPRIYAWAKETRGIGEHTIALLLGVIGDPRIAIPHEWQAPEAAKDDANASPQPPSRVLVAGEPYPRNIAKLWAYCGVGDPTRKRRAGMSQADAFALGSPDAKRACHLLAEAQVKTRGAYRHVYDEARVQYAGREDWTLLHQHNAALRRVKKEILRDLWVVAGDEAKPNATPTSRSPRLRLPASHRGPESHIGSAGGSNLVAIGV